MRETQQEEQWREAQQVARRVATRFWRQLDGEIEEPMQDALEKVVRVYARSMEDIDARLDSLEAFVTTVTYNTAIDATRRRGRTELAEPEFFEQRSASVEPHEVLSAQHETRRILEAIAMLDNVGYREAVSLSVIRGLRSWEVAAELGIREDKARQWISRGLKEVRRQLELDRLGGTSGLDSR